MREFHGPQDHDAYVDWLNAHPTGYVVQVNQSDCRRLHRATCRWIGGSGAPPTNGDCWTTFAKLCSDRRSDLASHFDFQCRVCNP